MKLLVFSQGRHVLGDAVEALSYSDSQLQLCEPAFSCGVVKDVCIHHRHVNHVEEESFPPLDCSMGKPIVGDELIALRIKVPCNFAMVYTIAEVQRNPTNGYALECIIVAVGLCCTYLIMLYLPLSTPPMCML